IPAVLLRWLPSWEISLLATQRGSEQRKSSNRQPAKFRSLPAAIRARSPGFSEQPTGTPSETIFFGFPAAPARRLMGSLSQWLVPRRGRTILPLAQRTPGPPAHYSFPL